MTTNQLSALLQAEPAAVLQADRSIYTRQVTRAADLVASNLEARPVVLLAGPSGSGKTTTARLLARELDRRGIVTHALQMDDWFSPLTPEEIVRMERNEIDLETPSRVDIPLFQAQLSQLLHGERVKLPHYNFQTSRREYNGRTLRRKPGELVIIEGIHALNPEVAGHMEDTTRLYVSVRTRIAAQDGTILHPSKIRLSRRMLRDSRLRGRDMRATLAMWERVDAGEQRYIMPYKVMAHASIDTFFSAELGIYRPLLLKKLRSLLPHCSALADLILVMQELVDVDLRLLPPDSLLREFVGSEAPAV